MQRSLWLVLALLALGGASYLVLGGGSSATPFDGPPVRLAPDEPEAEEPAEQRSGALGRSTDAVERRELEMAADLGLVDSGTDLDARAPLRLRGRVVDAQGNPIAGAAVEPRIRRNPRALFGQGGGGPGGGGMPFDPGTDFRALFRDRALAKAATTGADGTFAFDGAAFARGSTVELAVQHRDFAPSLVREDWTDEDGELVLEDVVLGAGATLTGVVLGPSGAGVASAEVRFDQANGGGRGGRGGGRGGPGGGRFGGDDQRLVEMVGVAETDASGRFSMRHVPAGSIRLLATARLHVDGRSEPVDAVDGAEVDVGTIELGPGAELTGIVVDQAGAPVAAAEVSASISREAMIEQFRQARELGLEDAGGRGGRGAGMGAMMNGGFGGSRTSTTTDAQGRFALDRVPQAPLRVEIRHPEYVDEDLEPVDPVAQNRVQVTVQSRPAASGLVIDAGTGQPIESYGIRARPAPGNFGAFGGRGGGNPIADMAQRFGEANPEVAARIAEMQGAQERQAQWRKQFVGNSGVVPSGRAPEIGSHPDGRFRLEGLQPSSYLFEVDAPGYVRVAAGPFEVATEASNEGHVVKLERGHALAGRVSDGRTRQPIGGARVSVSIPPLDDGGAAADPMAMFGGMRGGRGGGRGGFGGMDVLDQARTAADGSFELRPLRAGTYLLRIDADGYPQFEERSFTLGSGTGEAEFRLDPGARVHGRVLGLEPGTRARLEFAHQESNERRTTAISPDDGSYEISGLMAGGYFVSVQEDGRRGGNDGGRGGAGMRAAIGAIVASRSGAAPDLIVPAGGDISYDVGAQTLDLATVRGRVYRNGQPGAGLEVRLVAQVQNTGLDPQIERFAAGRLAGLFSGRVSETDGTFTIESVPPGDYSFEVRNRQGGGGGRGGPQLNFAGGGGGSLHSEPITVRKGQTIERFVEVSVGSFEITVTGGTEGQAIGRGRATIVLTAEAGNLPPEQWNGLPSLTRAGLRDGVVRAEGLRPGSYRVLIQGNGYQPQTLDVAVNASDTPTRTEVRLVVDPNAPAPQNGGGGTPPAGGAARPGGQPAGGRGGQPAGGRGGR
jgi:protocatechuate 3,4-dioxygenase beta subunit